jgi:alkylated DNA repair dioxygenase AlkB
LSYQGSFFGSLQPGFDADFTVVERIALDERSWVDVAPGWLDGADTLFDELVAVLPLEQRTNVKMYDRLVDEPRLTAWWHVESGEPEPLPILRRIRLALAERYDDGFDSIGFNLYRDGNDSVAWHGDRHRHVVAEPIVAILSIGARRPLRIRPRSGGASRGWQLGDGDLFVMGGACQHEWEHTVPKQRAAAPRMSVTFRNA